jgi:sugar phosphate isomerase/epimerase
MMKLSIVLSTQPASFSALVYKGRLEENVNKIKNLGYDGVELAVRDPGLLETAHVPAIGTGQAFGEDGLSFTFPDIKIREKAVQRIKSHVQLAKSLKSIVIIGLVRGKKSTDIDDIQVEQWLIDALKECAGEDKTVKLAIEPINRYETDIINTVDSG